MSDKLGSGNDGNIRIYGTWFGSQFNLWFYTKSSLVIDALTNIPSRSSIVLQYLWGGTYSKIQYDNWPFIPGNSYSSNSVPGISVSISPDGSGVTLQVNNITLAGGGPTLNFTRGFYKFNDSKGNATFCGNLGNYKGYGYSTVRNLVRDYVLDGLPGEALTNPRCDT